MRVGELEVTVARPGGDAFPEVRAGGETFVVATAGAGFEVRIARRDARGEGGTPQNINCELKVDGRCPGESRRLARPGGSSAFVGFVARGDCAGISYALFRFAAAPAGEGPGEGPGEGRRKAGRLAVSFFESVEAGPREPGKTYGVSAAALAAPAAPAGRDRVDEKNKKGGAPSLTTGTAGEWRSSGFGTTRYVAVGAPLATFKLRYETAAALVFRGVLRRDDPAHAAILDADPATRAEAPRPEVVDLVGAEPRAAAEAFECDLTDEAAPRWSKRARVEVAL